MLPGTSRELNENLDGESTLMTAAEYLRDCSQRAERHFSNDKDIRVQAGGIDILDVFLPVIVTHGYASYRSPRRWLDIVLAAVKGGLKICRILIGAAVTKATWNIESSSIFMVCGTHLSLREIHCPLANARGRTNLAIAFTTARLSKAHGEMIEGLPLPLIRPTSRGILYACGIYAWVVCGVLGSALRSFRREHKEWREITFILLYIWWIGMPLIFYSVLIGGEITGFRYKCMLLDDSYDPSVRFLSQVTKNKGLPSCLLQFGHCDKDAIEWKFANADQVLVWGEYYRAIIAGYHGRDDLSIVSIGSPRFDYLFEGEADSRILNKKKRILVLSTYTSTAYKAMLNGSSITKLKVETVDSLYRIACDCDIEVHIKPHPYETEEEIGIWKRAEMKNVVILSKNEDIRSKIKGYNLIVSFGSGLTLDCLIARIPVMLPSWVTGFPWEYGMLIDAGAWEANSQSAFEREILKSMGIGGATDPESPEPNPRIGLFVKQTGPVSRKVLELLSA